MVVIHVGEAADLKRKLLKYFVVKVKILQQLSPDLILTTYVQENI